MTVLGGLSLFIKEVKTVKIFRKTLKPRRRPPRNLRKDTIPRFDLTVIAQRVCFS